MPTGIYKRSKDHYNFLRGKKLSKETKLKISNALTRRKLSEEHKRKLKIALIGKNVGKHHTAEARKKISKAGEGKIFSKDRCDNISKSKLGKKRPILSNEKHWNWKGGVTEENKKIRMSLEMKLFKRTVLERDNYTCQKTGQRGIKLIVHHINNYKDFPKLRFDIDNGITLSTESHRNFHSIYGYRNNTREQLLEFLKDKTI
jgi:hypothetical protein